jgi:hypothetical protein
MPPSKRINRTSRATMLKRKAIKEAKEKALTSKKSGKKSPLKTASKRTPRKKRSA